MLLRMVILRGRIERGRIIVDDPIDLPDGTEVEIAVAESDEMTAKERAELDASLERGMEQAARGEGISAPVFIEKRGCSIRRCLMPKSQCHLYFERAASSITAPRDTL